MLPFGDSYSQGARSSSGVHTPTHVQEHPEVQVWQLQPPGGVPKMAFILCGGPTDALTYAARREVRSQAAKRVSHVVRLLPSMRR